MKSPRKDESEITPKPTGLGPHSGPYTTPDKLSLLTPVPYRLSLSPPQRFSQSLSTSHQIGSADHLKRGKIDYISIDGDGDRGGVDGYNDDDEGGDGKWCGGGSDDDDSPQSSPLAMSAMIRVTSFSAFSSEPIYYADDAERRMGKLKK